MYLYKPESVYRLDQAAIADDGIAEIELMQRAGRSVWEALSQRWPDIERITVFAGPGNNGGDAFVVALCAREQGVDVQLLTRGDLARQSAASRHFRDLWQQRGGMLETWQGQQLSGQIVVDGLLGIGLQRELDADWQQLIAAINAHPAPRVAVDIPSGLSGLTGRPQPVAVEAQLTVTFIGRKTGQFLADGPDYCGDLVFEDLGVSARSRAAAPAELETVDTCQLPPTRKRNSHKNDYGHVLIIGGDRGMSGAVSLAARAALRSGAGLVTALVHPDCRHNLASTPEIMVSAWDALAEKLPLASIVVVGPGLGASEAVAPCLQALRAATQPIVVDASALVADFLQTLEARPLVITPHPGEAAALLQTTSGAVQADRIAACRSLVEKFDATCVLKGSGSLIGTQGESMAVNIRGNPGMASAGMGDVLSGMIAAFMGQGLGAFEAARTAVLIHALGAEDFSREQDQSGLIATDVIERIPAIVRRLRDGD